MAEAAHVLAGTTTSLAVVPSGSANLLALNLGIPTDREGAMRLALAGQAHPTDVARTTLGAFVIAAGMGLDARIMRDADRTLKDRYGHLAYFMAAGATWAAQTAATRLRLMVKLCTAPARRS